ncbi:hypothetical protein Aple_024670 [Acrocarpospora pleiomorpha]|uniref:Uncharacterized protein n=1 Tax=Acrocarpospora pleiomorpha TaxID=90975 RepID=A0A5M3XIR3_9ACTN|nr:hypothetical protein Aple_024670 [Acrocarpospora pleiomorpha]
MVMESLEGTQEGVVKMSKVFSAHAVSVDGYITGRDPGAGSHHLHYEVER